MKFKSLFSNKVLQKAFFSAFLMAFFLPAQAHAGGFFGFLDRVDSGIGSFLNTVNSGIRGVLNTVGGVFDELGLGWLWNDILDWVFGTGTCGQQIQGGVGEVLCNVVISSDMLPALISGLAYLMGLIMTVVAIVKLKDHVVNPEKTPISEAVKRFIAGGALFALPVISSAVRDLLVGEDESVASYEQSGGFSGTVSQSGGLDSMMVMFVADIWQPLQILLGSFAYVAGLVFLVVGISRLLQTAQQGPRGPAGIGTIMTFVTAGVLFSLDNLMGAFSSSMFATNNVATYAMLSDTTGDAIVDSHVESVISAVLGFMALVGWISFIRGFFILRDVAEGNGQASLMVATTHMFGGALAVNLGPLMNAVQSTFGVTPFGVIFTT